MKLTTDQLTELSAFIKSKGYSEPDIHMEILDHLACDVEDRMDTLSFSEALSASYKSFGIFGFSDIVEGLQKAYKREVWNRFKATIEKIIKIPWLFVSLGFIYFFYKYTLLYSFYVPGLVVLLGLFINIFLYFKMFYRREKQLSNFSIIKGANLGMGLLGSTISSFNLLYYFSSIENIHWITAISFIWVLLTLGIFTYTFVEKNYALEKAEEMNSFLKRVA